MADERKLLIEMRKLLLEMAIRGDRVKFGSCWRWSCQMCGGTDVAADIKHPNQPVQHGYYCPVGRILEETKEFREASR